MNLLPHLLSAAYPLCATEGADGVPVPGLLDFSKLTRPRPKNSCLGAPPGMHVRPDILTRLRDSPPWHLYTTLRKVAEAQPRTFIHVAYDDQLQAHYVARSARANFPDVIAMQITPDSMPLLYSRSLYGRLDFGVNRTRLVTWLMALDAALGV
jgi:Protein of unknown function (DUF1499)